jgi:signal peptidase I
MVVFFCLFLLLRTIAVEPFGVPTGSMSPTLFGNHREAECSRCGYRVVVGEPGPDARPVRFAACHCPNCGRLVDLSRASIVPGDRLMVDKTAFRLRRPRRWEVAVFNCPADDYKPYVKRVAGLPGEFVQVSGGDVYANGELARKTLAQLRETRVPFFDMNYPPEPNGWGCRWLVEPLVSDPKLPATGPRQPAKPVDGTVLRDNTLFLNAAEQPEGVGLTYRHWNFDRRAEEPVGDDLAYNGDSGQRRGGFARRRPAAEPDPVHDFVMVFDLRVLAGSGTFSCRLGDGADTVRADLQLDGDTVTVCLAHDAEERTGRVVGIPFGTGQTHRVEFAFADRRASVAVDGVEVVPALDLPADPPGRPRRGGVRRPAQLGARGVSVVVQNLRLERDIHYLPVGKAAAGWRLGPDEFFFLGDNAGNSHDSRAWRIDHRPAPGVPEAQLIGKPFLIHQPLRVAGVTVNGREYLFQTLDWSRLRLLR